MFSVYGTSGLMYRGPMESLRQVMPAARVGRVRGVESVTDPMHMPNPAAAHAAAPESGRALHALTAYSGVQHPPVQRHPLRWVADVMSTLPVTLPATLTVRDGWRRLAEAQVGQAPVVDESRRVVGMLSRAELMQPERLPQPDGRAVVWLALMAQPLTAVMLTPVPCVSPDTDLRRLAWVLLDTGLQGLPVVGEEGVVTGFVSRSDILKALVHDPPLDLWAG